MLSKRSCSGLKSPVLLHYPVPENAAMAQVPKNETLFEVLSQVETQRLVTRKHPRMVANKKLETQQRFTKDNHFCWSGTEVCSLAHVPPLTSCHLANPDLLTLTPDTSPSLSRCHTVLHPLHLPKKESAYTRRYDTYETYRCNVSIICRNIVYQHFPLMTELK